MSETQVHDLVQDGVTAAKGGDNENARRLLRSAIDLDTDNETARLWLANVAETALEALEHLDHVLTINPHHVKAQAAARAARTRAGVAAAKAKDVLLARRLLRRAVADDPQCEKAWVWLASVSETPEDALVALEQAYDLNPDNEQTRDALARYRTLADAPLEEVSNEPEEEASPAPPAESRRTLLLIDDSQSVRRVVTWTLEQQGYHVQSAASWCDAIDILRAGVPHLILLDVTLPDGDGFQMCKLLGQNTETAGVPVILLTDAAGFVASMRGRMAGAVDVVVKSLELDGLISAVERHTAVATS